MKFKPIPETFVCCACGELRDFYSQAIIMASHPAQAEYLITGMPCVFSGFCNVCLEDGE